MKRILLFASCSLAGILASNLYASTRTWDGDVSNDWNTADNWDGNTLPSSSDDIIVSSSASNYLIVDETVTCNTLEVEGRLDLVSGGVINTTSNFYTEINSTFNMTGGTLNIGDSWKRASGYSAYGTITISSGALLGPPIILGRDGQQDEWLSMPIEGTMPKLHVSGEEWKLPEDMVSWMVSKQYSLSYVESGPVFCPSTDVIPEVNATGDWVRELADRSSILFAPPYENPSETGTIRIDNYGWLLGCNGTHIVKLWEVTEGPEVLINGFPSGSTFPGSSQNPNLGFIGFTIENRENYSMPLSMELSGDAGIWSMPSSLFFLFARAKNLSVPGPKRVPKGPAG